MNQYLNYNFVVNKNPLIFVTIIFNNNYENRTYLNKPKPNKIVEITCIDYNVHCILYNVQCTVYNAQWTMYSVNCTLYIIMFTLCST